MVSLTTIFPGGFNSERHTKKDTPVLETPPEIAFSDVLMRSGFVDVNYILPGKIQRVSTEEKPRKKTGWYIFFPPDGIHGIAGGCYGDWARTDTQYWCSKAEKDLTSDESAAYQAHVKEMQAITKRVKKEAQDTTAKATAEAIDKLPLLITHPYLERKGVKAYGVYAEGKALLVPMRNINGDVRSVQRIYENGDKRFQKDGEISGNFHLIGSAFTEPTYITEGYATAATIHQITGKSALVAFNTGNLKHVVNSVREAGNRNQLVICADNDRKTEGNPGVTAAEKAREGHVSVKVIVPQFAGTEGTDFNDLATAEGDDVVSGQLLSSESKTDRMEEISKFLIPLGDLKAEAPEWLIDDVLPEEGIGVLFGPSSGGKSFAVLDMALNIASGTDWHGNEVHQAGSVIYVCGEGHQGIANRIRAWEKHHGRCVDDLPFRVTRGPVRFLEEADTTKLRLAIEAAEDSLGKPSIIIIDTLNRNWGDGDENSTKDMTRFVDAITDIYHQYYCAILVVHHTNLTDADRSRGNGSLKNACDFEIKHKLTSGDEGAKTFCLIGQKMKDGAEMQVANFELEYVKLGVSNRGKEFGSCIIKPCDAPTGDNKPNHKLGKLTPRQEVLITFLQKQRETILSHKPDAVKFLIETSDLREHLKTLKFDVNNIGRDYEWLAMKKLTYTVNTRLLEIIFPIQNIDL